MNTKPVRHVVQKASAVAMIAGAVLLAAPMAASAGIQGTGHAAHTAGVGGTGRSVVSVDGISGGGR